MGRSVPAAALWGRPHLLRQLPDLRAALSREMIAAPQRSGRERDRELESGVLPRDTPISHALRGAFGRYDEQFHRRVPAGSGTPTNMNMNEVVATLASQR